MPFPRRSRKIQEGPWLYKEHPLDAYQDLLLEVGPGFRLIHGPIDAHALLRLAQRILGRPHTHVRVRPQGTRSRAVSMCGKVTRSWVKFDEAPSCDVCYKKEKTEMTDLSKKSNDATLEKKFEALQKQINDLTRTVTKLVQEVQSLKVGGK